jgi:aryl-alcohol dehydrogenase-like predicted oxidoreductase
MKSLDVSDRYGWARYVGHQVYYSLIGREYEWELMPLGADQGVGALIWSPLGWGRLTGKDPARTAAAGGEPAAQDRRHGAARWTMNIYTKSWTRSTKLPKNGQDRAADRAELAAAAADGRRL